ncbi:MAG TPA: diguanylate cyclase [Bryobacteraceae bacterium]|nr:diguanylate cyclase [Bryobacteraceae bacterium]
MYVAAIIVLGILGAIGAVPQWPPHGDARFSAFFLIAALGSSLKVKLPALRGTMSIGFVFCLIGIMEFSLWQVIVIAIESIVIQSLWRVKKTPRTLQLMFNVASMCLSVFIAYIVYHSKVLRVLGLGPASLFAIAVCTQFAFNSFPVAWIIAQSERKSFPKILRECYFWSFPYYLVGAALAGGFCLLHHWMGWEVAILSLPVVYIIYGSYRSYLQRLEDEKSHAEQMDGLHWRTIQALALAIQAKDISSHDRNHRVQVYAVEIGKEMGLSESDLKALRAAAVLHDIGNLAIPENIISKPGRLTPEEFEKMKIHALIGAEIIEEVEFPYPVAAIVRAHHEKWNGSGYPYGLKGQDIPLAARILAAVDCLDALMSDRQYRRALSLDDAMAQVAADANRAFDPDVVAILQQRYRELENMARATSVSRRKLPAPADSDNRASSPENQPHPNRQTNDLGFLSSIAAASHEAQALFDLSQTLGNSLSLNETLSVFAKRLNRIVPHDTIAIYLANNGYLHPEYVTGRDSELFSKLKIPARQGLSGWVLENRKPILNGNPAVETNASASTNLRSAVSVPLEGFKDVVGVLTLYHAGEEAFSKDDLRVLLGLAPKLGLSIENALTYQNAQSSATTDYLTELPNARSLFLQLQTEVSRALRSKSELTVLVCDLDGFKQVNDRFGHLEGNRLLKLIANSLRSACRDYDYVARLGGDEFVIILPALQRDLVARKMEQISHKIEEIGQQLYGEDLLGVSIGEASFPADGRDPESVLAEADLRMYRAKQQRKAGQSSRATAAPQHQSVTASAAGV